MNTILRYRGLHTRTVWQGEVETQLKRLENLTAIASSEVTLEWQHEIKPAFRVAVLLEVAGPDYHAETRDHTIQAALLKVVKDLERQIRSRKNRRVSGRKANCQLGLLPG
jgi:ribosome-associated translation inhibitor RaiA